MGPRKDFLKMLLLTSIRVMILPKKVKRQERECFKQMLYNAKI